MFKRIIPCFLILAILFSVVLPVFVYASAVDDVKTLDSLADMITDNDVWSWQYDPNKTYGGCTVAADGNHIINDNYVDGFGGQKVSYGLVSQGECTLCHQGLGQIVAYDKAHGGETGIYQDYVSKNYPLDGYGSDGGLYWFPVLDESITFQVSTRRHDLNALYSQAQFHVSDLPFSRPGTWHSDVSVSLIDDRSFSVSLASSGEYYFDTFVVGLYYSYLFAPLSGDYCYVDSPFLNNNIFAYRFSLEKKHYGKGGTLWGTNGIDSVFGIRISDALVQSGSFVFHMPVFKVVPDSSPDTNLYVQNTRVGSVNFNLATKQGDTVTNVYQDVTIVNENTNVYTDPTTGSQQNIQSWTYDYSTRTYHLTLEDGSLLDVEFGEDSIKVKLNGELTQEYYYTVENEEPEPTPSPTPSPSPEPGPVSPAPEPTPTPTPDPSGGEVDPSPSPDPGTGGEDEPPDGFFEWLKQWLIDFKEWLGDWLDKLLHKEPGDITIDESDNSVHIEDNDSIDYDIYYSDDQGEQHQTSLRDILHKFGFLHDIYDLGRDMFTIVGADAAAAYAYDPGRTIDITPYLGDLRTVDAADIMPIAGAPSLKLDLGAAQSHYGYEYGGEIEFLDLSWYTPYKQTVDSLLSGFLWLMFIWRLFKVAPGIISGAGMVTDKAEDIHDGKRH